MFFSFYIFRPQNIKNHHFTDLLHLRGPIRNAYGMEINEIIFLTSRKHEHRLHSHRPSGRIFSDQG